MCKIFSYLCLMLLGATSVFAQSTFHGAVLYDATGSVKEIKLDTEDPLANQKKVKFTENGKINGSMMTYNEAGYPIGFGLQMGSREMNLSIDYNRDNLVDSLTFKSNITGSRVNLSVVNSYDDKGELIHRTVARSANKKNEESKKTRFAYTYSNFVVDAASNWISRSVVLEITDSLSAPVDRMEYTESRTIKYYVGRE